MILIYLLVDLQKQSFFLGNSTKQKTPNTVVFGDVPSMTVHIPDESDQVGIGLLGEFILSYTGRESIN
jgi:hypothetical protein